MKIKTVMCDIYGTLLTDEGTITGKTIEAIKAIRKRGILFGLCTKHDVTSVLQQLNSWNLEGNVDIDKALKTIDEKRRIKKIYGFTH